VIVGASVLYGEHQEYAKDFVRDNLAFLKSVPSAFFSVRRQVQNKEYVEQFTQETGWKPEQVATIGGAAVKGYEYDSFYLNQVARLIHFSERRLYFLNPLIRFIFKREISLTRRDGLMYLAFTNWEEIKRFTETFLGRLSQPAE
jgi:menaquinone-dependent protoporphyrinogen IX oxidase